MTAVEQSVIIKCLYCVSELSLLPDFQWWANLNASVSSSVSAALFSFFFSSASVFPFLSAFLRLSVESGQVEKKCT